MNLHIQRAGRAFQVLWSQYSNWHYDAALMQGNGSLRRWFLLTKTKALIKHDSILRSEA